MLQDSQTKNMEQLESAFAPEICKNKLGYLWIKLHTSKKTLPLKCHTICTYSRKNALEQWQLIRIKHIPTCQRTINNQIIDVEIIVQENDPIKLRLFAAFYNRKCNPELNSREECINSESFYSKLDYLDILFSLLLVSDFLLLCVTIATIVKTHCPCYVL